MQAPNTYATIGPGNAAHGGLKRILTATGGIHDKGGSQQKLAPSTSSPSLDKITGALGATGGANLGSHRSSSSLLSLSSFNINSVYTKVSLSFGWWVQLGFPLENGYDMHDNSSFTGMDGFGHADERP